MNLTPAQSRGAKQFSILALSGSMTVRALLAGIHTRKLDRPDDHGTDN